MANRTDPHADTVHGGNPQYLVDRIVRLKIYNDAWWKEHCFALTTETLIDKAIDIDYVGGTYGGRRRPTKFLCLILKMLQIQPEEEVIMEYIKQTELKYLRALGILYLRLTGRAMTVYQTLEPLYADYRKLRYRDMFGKMTLIHIDEFVDWCFHEATICDVSVPSIPKRLVMELSVDLEPYRSVLEDDLDDLEELEQQLADEEREKAAAKAADDLIRADTTRNDVPFGTAPLAAPSTGDNDPMQGGGAASTAAAAAEGRGSGEARARSPSSSGDDKKRSRSARRGVEREKARSREARRSTSRGGGHKGRRGRSVSPSAGRKRREERSPPPKGRRSRSRQRETRRQSRSRSEGEIERQRRKEKDRDREKEKERREPEKRQKTEKEKAKEKERETEDAKELEVKSKKDKREKKDEEKGRKETAEEKDVWKEAEEKEARREEREQKKREKLDKEEKREKEKWRVGKEAKPKKDKKESKAKGEKKEKDGALSVDGWNDVRASLGLKPLK